MAKRILSCLTPCVVLLLLAATPLFAQQDGRSPDRLRGGLWGGGIGLVAGGVLGGLTAPGDDDSLVEATAVGLSVAAGAILGLTVGAALGATVFAPSRRVDQHAVVVRVAPVLRTPAPGIVAVLQWRPARRAVR